MTKKVDPVDVEQLMIDEMTAVAATNSVTRMQAAGLVSVVILSAAALIVMALAAVALEADLALQWVVVCALLSYATQVAALSTVYTESRLLVVAAQGLWASAVGSGLVATALILLA